MPKIQAIQSTKTRQKHKKVVKYILMEESPKFSKSYKDFIPVEAENADDIEVYDFDSSMNDTELAKQPKKALRRSI